MLAGGWNAGDKVVKIADEAIWNHAKGYVGGADEGRVSIPIFSSCHVSSLLSVFAVSSLCKDPLQKCWGI